MKKSPEQWTLGDLIAALARRPAAQSVIYDYGNLSPVGLWSYRGFYEDLALGFGSVPVEVGALLEFLRNALGSEMTGYKGGHYGVSAATPLWVSQRSDAASTIIVGLEECEHETVIRTRWLDV